MGGELVHCGDYKSLKKNKDSITSKYLNKKIQIEKTISKNLPKEKIKIKNEIRTNSKIEQTSFVLFLSVCLHHFTINFLSPQP